MSRYVHSFDRRVNLCVFYEDFQQMSQRDSGYERKPLDCYETPEWVTLALVPHLPRPPRAVWEPARGSGKMMAALGVLDVQIVGTDIATGDDFFSVNIPSDAIITNPPYDSATQFIIRALCLMEPVSGMVAMLLRTDFDHAASRRCLFADCASFCKKIVLTKRIRWIEGSTGQPSFNHAWFIWDWQHKGPPTLAYGP